MLRISEDRYGSYVELDPESTTVVPTKLTQCVALTQITRECDIENVEVSVSDSIRQYHYLSLNQVRQFEYETAVRFSPEQAEFSVVQHGVKPEQMLSFTRLRADHWIRYYPSPIRSEETRIGHIMKTETKEDGSIKWYKTTVPKANGTFKIVDVPPQDIGFWANEPSVLKQ